MTEANQIEQLYVLAEAIRAAVQARGGERPPPAVFSISLAKYFDYNLSKGGFGQLLYNLQGQHLDEIEQLLMDADAKVALGYYLRALRACLDDGDGYQAFLAGDFRSDSSIKDALQLISFEYFEKSVEFSSEVGDFVERWRPTVEAWLRG